MGRDDIPDWNSDQIISAQRSKGMTNEEFQKANDIAKEVRENIRAAKRNQEQITPPKPQLKGKNRGGVV